MQSFHVLHLLISISLTTTFVDAQYYNEARCPSMCGDVKIAYPFGIGRYCSANKWYTVDCKSSTVPYPSSTPYLSALNNVEILYISSTTLIVNMSINNPDCKNPIQDSNLGLSKSPFRFSGLYNILVVQGCGSGVIVDENGTIVAGCSTTCGNDTVSDINNCFGVGCCQTTIPHGLESFTFNLTGLERKELYGKESCGSAFIVNTYYAGTFSRQSMIADHTFFPISLSWNNSTGCKDTCGEVMIPYPFGMGSYCSRDKWFNVDCNSSTPYLSAFNNVQMLGVDLERGRVTVNVSKISGCDNSYNLVLSGSPFRFSRLDNLFVVEGCGNAAIMDENGTIVAGCSTTCEIDSVIGNINNCFGVGCCQTKIPYDIGQSFTLNQTGLEKHGGNGSCGHAFLVDRKSFIEGRLISGQFVPITLGYTESDYDVSTECISCEELGGYCYPSRFVISYMACFYESNRKSHNGVILGVSISTGVLLLTAITYALCKRIKKTKVKRRKQRCFKRNGGLLLKQQEATHSGFVDKTILFTSNELEKATDNYNENRILGKGGQGTVYKGMLADGRIVAIKKSKVVDESQLEQFINEVVILSQVSHRNVVKLMGCSLETEVPLLVSEFISNGTLYDFIQDESSEFSISLNMRLQIATEVAGALSYLHSSTSVPIYHRDIKSTNILLDEKYRAKVSDFGTSRFVSIDHSHLTTLVKGTFGYLDPEYFQSSQFTDKSDVYSFGVVLLELLTREKPIFSTRFGEYKSLATHFMETMEEGRVLTVFDAMVVEEGSRSELLAIANLASRCLNLKGKHRPTMKEVALELEGLRLSHVPSTSHTISGHLEYGEKVPQIYYGSTSTSTSLTCDDDHINESW